jgi:hypothetical protein
MSLHSGQRITRYAWDAIPMPNNVIARVNLLGKDQPEELTFYDRRGRPIGNVELPGVDPGEDCDEPEILENIPVADNDHNPPINPPMQFAPPPDPF